MSLFILPQRELNAEPFNVENEDDFVYMLEQTLGYEVAKYCRSLVNGCIEADGLWEMYNEEQEKNEQLRKENEQLKKKLKMPMVIGNSFVFELKGD